MARSVEELEVRIHQSIRPGFRGQLSARGLARNLIWSAGILPLGSPPFSPLLSSDLLSYGLSLFTLGLQLRQRVRDNPNIAAAFEHAGQAIESVIRDGNPTWNERGFYTVVAAAAYHLGHFSARAFSLFPSQLETLNLSPAERVITWLMRRDLSALRSALFEWASADGGFDLTLANRLTQSNDELDFDLALTLTLNSLFHKAIAHFDFALEAGSADAMANSLRLLDEGIIAANEFQSVPFWWVFTIARHLVDDLWGESLHVRLPNPDDDEPTSQWRRLRRLFIAELHQKNRAEIDLWPSQLAAAQRAFDMSDDLIAALPTSAGKTRIAEICILRALSVGGRVLFVTPLRALSAQTERNLRRIFTPLGFSVSSLYGSSGTTGEDTDSLQNRDIVVTTPEKLDFALRNNPAVLDDVRLIVLDEAHTIGAGEREIRYEVLVQRLLRRADSGNRRIVCLSAILPTGEQLQDFVSWIRQDQDGDPITKNWRPTRQRFGEIFWSNNRARLSFRVENETPFVDPFVVAEPPRPPRKTRSFPSGLQELTFASAWRLVDQGQTVLIYCPQRRSVNALAKTALTLHRQGLLSSILETDASVLKDALSIGREWLGEFHPAVECLKLGIAVHHAQLPRPFLRAIEVLLRNEVLKVTIASPTLAQGLNLSATTVLFYSLMRGRETISGEEFANVAGRAGRAFVDVEGRVLCVATEPKHLAKWNKVLRAAKERDLRSGLFQLVQEFCVQLAMRKNFSPDEIIAYVMGNAAAWEPPTPAKLNNDDERKLQEDFERKWRIDLACLDSALLSLVQQDVNLADLAKAIDDALQSSLWQRTLRRQDEVTQKLSKALLLGRAGFIWKNSTAAQRKGYFFAGVSFTTGRYLDEHAKELNRLLQSADDNIVKSQIDEAISAMIGFAEIAFAVEPFKPEDLPDNWKDILRAWVRGENMSDLAGAKDAELLEFIEGGLVYRLVWAMEAIRVRAGAVGGEEEFPNEGQAALAIETGTSNRCAALLIQSGLASRVAAMKAINDCPANFHDVRGLRAWLRNKDVAAKQSDPEWPTPETASLWHEFVVGLERSVLKRWDIHDVELPAVWENEAPTPGRPLRIFHDAQNRETTIYSVDLDRLGSITPAFSQQPVGILLAKAGPSSNSIVAEYLGPSDLVKSSPTPK